MPYNRHTHPRAKGVQIHRPFIYGSVATPIDPSTRPPDLNPDHTHRWTVFIRPVPHPNSDLTHWLKRAQFKLHETYTNATRTIDGPGPFEVTETGWGEFEVQIKLWFVPEANEKSQTLWHALKLHPFGPDAEEVRRRGGKVESLCYEEVIFSEPVEGFLDVLTGGAGGGGGGGGAAGGGGGQGQGKGQRGGKGGKGGGRGGRVERTAEIPARKGEGNVFSGEMEVEELARLREAVRKVEEKVKVERGILAERESRMEGLRREGKNGG